MRTTVSMALVCAPVLLAIGVPCRAELDVILYPAYGTGTAAVVEGRVIDREKQGEITAEDGRARNLSRNLRSLMNDEQEDVPVTVTIGEKAWRTTTNQEGYFRILIEDLTLPMPGWHEMSAATTDGSGKGSLLLVPAHNVHGLISDFDDTVVISEVNDKSQLLANSLLLNYRQRKPVPDVAAAYGKLAATNPDTTSAPLFYLSASPRQLQSSIQAFLDHNNFPRGVLITKRVTNDASSEPLTNQFAYKLGRLVEVFERLPHVSFVLAGDDGEQDPEIYAAMQRRYPTRVTAIWIRRVHPDPARVRIEGQGDLAELLVPIVSSP
ncbi:phosphatidate phosphatase APP1 [Povalibacter uvarum]|uniref:Phosphatidate phosphatase APP1 n=1 Tax=Povalibacter uvarum TaxID=732238 RepID=A0A841HLS5_9GAMM|nr:phosphatase domain-containing protein [Povalibacter uvarum]MBB6094027.1 phosphatidate phosphatase APP1 [Povalibacter uvarum]